MSDVNTQRRDLLDLAERVVARARALGADEVTALASRGSHTSITRRDGKVEQATEATSRSVSVSLLVDEKFSSHGTSDLRPDALDAFLARAIEATRYLETDPDRRLPDPALCGRLVSDDQLEQLDPNHLSYTASDRAESAEALERAVTERAPASTISSATYVADGVSVLARVTSNGFADTQADGWFTGGAEMTITDPDGRRPEASAFYGARHRATLPGAGLIADEVVARALERVGSGPIASGAYTMVLENRAARQILGVLGGALSGNALHHQRSCLAGKLGERIGSDLLTIVDDPTVPRGLASRPWDGDGLIAERRPIVSNGVLQQYYLGVYYARKLGMPVTTGGRSNWILPVGTRSWREIAAEHGKVIFVNGFLGGNNNAATGDFSFGIQGVLLEGGVPTRPVSEMNVSGNTLTIFHQLVEAANDPWTFSSVITPSLVFTDVQFSGV